jgi:tetratricopeptide (TPR) repeat protein
MLMVRTEGNPFFIEESVRSLVESGVLAGERGDYRLVRPFEMAQVPATVQAVLAARIDRLAPEDKRLLQAAAVVGKDVPYPLLQAIAELPDDAVRQGLARLQAAEFLYETSLFPDLEYTFKHALTHEVGYASLLQERRRALHARIVAAIEQLYPDRLAEYVELLAHHAQRGELWDKAVGYLRQAGAKAAVRSSPREAVGYYEQALDVLAHLPQERGTSEQAIDLRLDLRNALLTLGEHDRILEHLRAAEALAVALDDQRRLAWVACYMSNYWWHIRANDRALDDGRRALATSRAIGDDILELEAAYVLGRAYDRLGDYRSAVDMYGTIVSGTAGGRARERFGQARPVAVVARSATIFCLIELGETAQAIARGEELMRLAEIVDQPFSLAVASSTLGMAYAHRGELERAIPLTQRGLDLCETWQIRLVLPVAQCLLGYQYTLSGRTEEALSLLRQASSPTVRFAALVWLSQAYLQAGRREDATEHAKDALEIYRQGKERGSEAYALRALGDITANAQPIDVDQAESYYRQALSLADELGARPLVAHCHLGLGTLYHKVSSTHQAQSELTIAFDMYRSMEMTFWLAKAEAGLTQAGAA